MMLYFSLKYIILFNRNKFFIWLFELLKEDFLMSRSTSYGYGSYGTHSYRSGNYGGKKHRKNNKKKKIIITIIIVVIVLALAVTGLYFLVFRNNNESETSKENENSETVKSEVSKEISEEISKQVQESSEQSVGDVPENPNIKGYYDGNVFIYDKQGYEMFYGTNKTAKEYAQIVSSIKKSLGSKVNVYNMVVPNHSAYGIPKSYRDEANDQYENIKTIYSSYSEDIKTIDIYETLNIHKNEYIYFKTDHNWTALGAYYAYSDFCKAAEIKSFDIKSASSGEIKNFSGALLSATKTDSKPSGNKDLKSNLDTVKYYNIPGEYYCYLLETGEKKEREVNLIATFAEGSNAYSAFIWGDNPYMRIETNNKNGKKLCIIKDSYGCAFAPYTVTNYEEVFIVDPRYYNGNILTYLKKNKYTDVLVINSIMTANTEVRLNEFKSILK